MAAPETRMWSSMELVHPLEPTGEESPLARARLHRQLTVEETARRAGITAEEVRWLEEGRVYRFPKPDDALIAFDQALNLRNKNEREPLSILMRRQKAFQRSLEKRGVIPPQTTPR